MKKPIYSPYFFRKNMTFSVLAVIICALLLAGVFSYFVFDSNRTSLEHSVNNANQTCYNQVENILDNATRICMFFASYKSISPVFQSQLTDIDLQQATLKEEMRTFIACNDFLAKITVETENYILHHGASMALDFSVPTKYKSFEISYSTDNNWPSVLRISFFSNNTDFYSVDVDIYTSYISSLYFDDNSYCYAPDGTMLLAADTSILGHLIGQHLKLSAEELSGSAPGYTKSSRTLGSTGFTIVTLQNNNSILSTVILHILSYLAVCILIFAVVIPIIYLQLKRIYRPIDKVIDIFKYYLPQNETYIEDDIRFISNCISDTDMGQATQSAVLQIRKSQLYTLQSQISPHFLGNSLDIINWKAVGALGLDNPISESLGILSHFLTDSYTYTSMFHSIGDEIARTKEYIKLAQYCFIKNLTVNWQADPGILGFSIISLTLQPLIENSIVHGFLYPENKANAKIDISILPAGNDIEIILQDNGCGMSEKALHELLTTLANEEQSKHHIGLKTSHLKLKLLYGSRYGITNIISNSKGTQIKLLIPQYAYPDGPQHTDAHLNA